VNETGDRVRAVYIREVTARGPERSGEVAAIASALRATGGHLVLARDSLAIAEDAVGLGLIAPEAMEAVRARVHSGLKPNLEQDVAARTGEP
jgi:hypothetical protein